MAKAIYSRFGEVQVTDRAAALTYYSILSLFPALLVLVSLLSLLGSTRRPTRASSTPCATRRRGRRSTRSTARCGTRSPTGATPACSWSSGSCSRSTPPRGRWARRCASLEAINRAPKGARFPAEPRRSPRADRARHAARAGRVPVGGRRRSALRLDRRRGRISRLRQGAGRLPALADRRGGPARRLRDRLRARAAAHTEARGPLTALGAARGGRRQRRSGSPFPSCSPSTSLTSALMTRPMAPSAR